MSRAGCRVWVGLFLTTSCGLFAGCSGDDPIPTGMRFTTLSADESGIDMVMTCGTLPSPEILEVNGGGLGLIDYDNDGDLDLFVANGATLVDPHHGPGCRLFENLGQMRFREATDAAGIALRRWAMGVAVGDYDGDGWDDLYITCYGPNALLRNVGGRFVDTTDEAGVGDPRWGTGCAFGDIDGDDDLDLYVVNYLEFDTDHRPPRSRFKGIQVMAGPNGLPAQHDVLYENLGDGTFRDITESSGCQPVQPAYGLGVVILDLDGDGRQDIFVGNDSMSNFLFHNLGDARFEETGVFSGLSANADGGEQATMGIGIADVDANRYPDVFTTNFSSDTNTLHLNLDGTFFEDRSMRYGLGMISRPFLGWTCGFYDFDLDGDEDLLMVNGHVYPQASMDAMDSPYEQPPLLFERDGRRFDRVTNPDVAAFLDEPHRDRCAVFGDLDDDGDIDVIVGELNGPIRVLRNESRGGKWLIVELHDDRASTHNHRALGSRIEVFAGEASQRRWIYSGGGFQSASAPQAHFGLPGDVSSVTVEVTWPDGELQRLQDVSLRQRLVVRRQE